VTRRSLFWWKSAVVFFGNVPNLLLVLWVFFWLARTSAAPAPHALWLNLGLFALFAVVHSLMASPAYKRLFAARFAPAYERAVFVIASGVLLLLLMALWRPMPAVIWDLHGAAGIALDTVFWAAFAATASVGRAFDSAAFMGTRQLTSQAHGTATPREEFVVKSWFRYSRHPMYFFMIVMVWSASTLTAGRLLFNLLATSYFLIGARFEERRLRAAFGDAYARYQHQVPMFLPRPNGYSAAPSATPREA
jgi:methanethiol S-methyltransferase